VTVTCFRFHYHALLCILSVTRLDVMVVVRFADCCVRHETGPWKTHHWFSDRRIMKAQNHWVTLVKFSNGFDSDVGRHSAKISTWTDQPSWETLPRREWIYTVVVVCGYTTT